MKRSPVIFIILTSVTVLVLIFNQIFTQRLNSIKDATIKESKTEFKNKLSLIFSDFEYETYWYVVGSDQEVELHSNLDEKRSATQAKEKYQCNVLVNGGFYDTENNHLGMVKIKDKMISSPRNSLTFDSFLSMSPDHVVKIGSDEPEGAQLFILQTGPFILDSGEYRKLSIKNDKYARRVVAGITSDEKFIFLIFVDKTTKLSGPQLSDLPEVLKVFEDKSAIDLSDATNLDGGSASIFITNEIKLTENQLVGSFFCIK